MGKLVNYSCRQLTEQKQMGSALKFSFWALSIQDRSFAATLDEFATYCAFIKRGSAWLKILSISVNPHCVYQGDLIRVRCSEGVWLLAYDISQRPVHVWGWPNPKTHAEKALVGKQHYYFVLEYVSTHKVALSNIQLGKLWGKLFKMWDIGKWWQL